MSDQLPAPVSAAITTWLDTFDRVAPGIVEGVYVVGSAALGDWQRGSDVDVVVFVADPADDDTVACLAAAHDEYRSIDGQPTFDGPFLAWGDVAGPPRQVRRAWTLDGEFHADDECFEINPLTWFRLAHHGVVARGVPVGELGVHVDPAACREWVRANVATYWRAVRDQIVTALETDPDRTGFDTAMTEWCALGIARMAYTTETGGVVSKSAAGRWAIERFPEHAAVLRRAVEGRVRADGADGADGPHDRAVVGQVVALMSELIDHIVEVPSTGSVVPAPSVSSSD